MNRIIPTIICVSLTLGVLLTCPCRGTAQPIALRDLALRLAPDGRGDPRQLADYIRTFRDVSLQDPRICAFHVDAQVTDDGSIILTGYAEFVEMRDALGKFLEYLGFQPVINNMELLPSEELGPRRFGLVTSDHSFVLTHPSGDASHATDAILGEPVFLLRDGGEGFLLCHTIEGYVGYVCASDILRTSADQFLRYVEGRQVYVTKEWISAGGVKVPLGARLKWVAQDAENVTVATPDGRSLQLPTNICDARNEVVRRELGRVMSTARQFLGTQYVWGGKSLSGVDCSGLVQVAFAAVGVHLPRDSNQQVFPGRLVATRWYRPALRPGDTLYFLGPPGRITHTGLYLGEGQYIEAVTPRARISSLRRGDENYSQRGDRTLAFAKRLLE